eukprot:NODE_1897_length_1364_cov_18.434221_g1717_i0.p1 GENE.NODE_1897_length_1364_cov_18.434221_g1717_i0~~NODE_1897_length_1364_cov_18.434221_g1717_i0.p1  ORF type:complete len:239 (+),score=39.04 NODE_1897_length_1364_cov_18.434221_g1717_i0:32-748(+)
MGISLQSEGQKMAFAHRSLLWLESQLGIDITGAAETCNLSAGGDEDQPGRCSKGQAADSAGSAGSAADADAEGCGAVMVAVSSTCLRFPVPFDASVVRPLMVENRSSCPVAFEVKGNASDVCRVKPRKGILASNERIVLSVSIRDPLANQFKHTRLLLTAAELEDNEVSFVQRPNGYRNLWKVKADGIKGVLIDCVMTDEMATSMVAVQSSSLQAGRLPDLSLEMNSRGHVRVAHLRA